MSQPYSKNSMYCKDRIGELITDIEKRIPLKKLTNKYECTKEYLEQCIKFEHTLNGVTRHENKSKNTTKIRK